jgi:hypothetical protein
VSVRLLSGLAICVCAVSASANPGQSRQASDGVRTSTVFADRVRAYVKLQKDPNAARIAAARRDARQGDIFTPEVAVQFHTIVRKAFRGPDARNMRRTIQEGDPATLSMLHVNDVYPEEIPRTTMPPTLLRDLPALPMELAYRIIGRALVLLDIKTDVIVDFIPDAIPRLR